MASGSRGTGERRWGRTARTRQIFLDAASDVLGEKGFAAASVADVVERTGLSVGSLYHHFGAKGELFFALYERHHEEQEEFASNAVARARARGEESRLELFLAGARAYLDGAWQRRDLMGLFMGDDAPPGFGTARHARIRAWIQRSAAVLETGGDPLGHLTVATLTSLVSEAARQVARSEDEKAMRAVVDSAEILIRRILEPDRDDRALSGSGQPD